MHALSLELEHRVTRLATRTYVVASGLIGIGTFVACQSYMVGHFGWAYGLAIGWLPSLFFAAVVSYLWPALALGTLILSFAGHT